MKKIVSVVLLALFCAGSLSAQDDKQYFPKAGDIGFLVSAGPIFFNVNNFIDEADNQVNGNGVLGGNNYGMYAKYFLQDNLALRVGLGMNTINDKDRAYVPDLTARASDPLSQAEVVDTWNALTNDFVLRLGAEMRRGSGRVQGFYGAELLASLGRTKNEYAYGNPITAANPVNAPQFGQQPGTTERFVSHNFGFGAGVFLGAEFFFAPKFSVGAEMSLHYVYTRTGRGEHTVETWDANLDRVVSTTTPVNAGNNISKVNMWNPAANIFFAFYF